MIIKTFELDKLKSSKVNSFLLYGENEGFKSQIIEKYFINKFKKNVNKYDENEVLNNLDNFISNLTNKSFFEESKLIVIYRATDKIFEIINDLLEKNIADTTILINAGILDKKSKLRAFFEKEKNLICIPFYSDDLRTLGLIAQNFFKDKNISISQETINLLVGRCKGDRQNLNNELSKIENFMMDRDKISNDEVMKISNLAENYNVSELTDSCLSKNIKKTINILNENNYSSEDCILILRTLLSKSKRLLKLKKEVKENQNIDRVISSFRPPIFWKDKEIVKKQIESWSLNNAENLIYKINEIEVLIKKNSVNSLDILSDFILNQSQGLNN